MWIAAIKSKTTWLRLRGKRVVFIIGTPSHNNIGDLAIAYAQSKFINGIGANISSVGIPFEVVMQPKKNTLRYFVQNGDILTGIGGGNMGDMYLREELCRRKFIQNYPSNKIVLFPQTIHFSDTQEGQKELEKTQSIYRNHDNLTVIAREHHSYEVMQRVFKANTVLFTPDIVLSVKASTTKRSRNGLLICLRNDQEAKVGDAERKIVSSFARKHFSSIRYTDTISSLPLIRYRRKNRIVENKFNEFRCAKLVVTDRLHGMVFAAVTGTPCIALASFNHKVTDTFKWLEHLPYIKFCDDVKKIESVLRQMDIDKTYDYDPQYYSKHWNRIRSAIVNMS